MSEIPQDIMRDAAKWVFDFESWVQATDFHDKDGIEASQRLCSAFAKAIAQERAKSEAEIKRLRRALSRLSREAPISVAGEIQGQSSVRMQYARLILEGLNP